MDQNFQTSFIPKKPVVEEQMPKTSKPVGFLMVLTIFIFLVMVGSTIALYFYKVSLSSKINVLKESLERSNNRFEKGTIDELHFVDKRLRLAKEILDQHIVVTPIFNMLSKATMKTIRYTNFSYDLDSTGKVLVKMSGQASWIQGYEAIALQSDIFALDDYRKFFIDPVFSNLTPDNKGNVTFDLQFSVDSSYVNYNNFISTNNS